MFVRNTVSARGIIQNNTECRSHQRRGRAQSTSVRNDKSCRPWERERERERERQTDRQTDRERHTERATERETQRDTERDRDRETDRQREGGERGRHCWITLTPKWSQGGWSALVWMMCGWVLVGKNVSPSAFQLLQQFYAFFGSSENLFRYGHENDTIISRPLQGRLSEAQVADYS